MAEYKYEQLKDMKVTELRDIAKDIQDPGLEGYTTMHKDHLLPALCKALHIHIAHAAQGSDKTRIKQTIDKLKKKRDESVAAKKDDQAILARKQIHVLKRRLRRMADAS